MIVPNLEGIRRQCRNFGCYVTNFHRSTPSIVHFQYWAGYNVEQLNRKNQLNEELKRKSQIN